MSDRTRRLTAEEIEFCVPFVERYVSNSEIIVQALRQAARDCRVIEGMRAWLKHGTETQEPGDTIGHFNYACREALDQIDRLERQP